MIQRSNHKKETRPSEAQADWSELIGRLADSLSGLIRAEIEFLEKRVTHAVTATISNAALRIAAVVVLAITGWAGLVCLLTAYVLLLHQWLRWWQAVGAGGVTVLLIGLVLFTILNAMAGRSSTD